MIAPEITAGQQFVEKLEAARPNRGGLNPALPPSAFEQRFRELGMWDMAAALHAASVRNHIRYKTRKEMAGFYAWRELEEVLLDSCGGDDTDGLRAEIERLSAEAAEREAAWDLPAPAGLPDFLATYDAAVRAADDFSADCPALPKSTTYHVLKKVGLWEKASKARLAGEGQCIATGWTKKDSKQWSWFMLEQALVDSLGGKCMGILNARLDALLAGDGWEDADAESESEAVAA